MSFPFYRNSSSRNRSRDEIRSERNSMVATNVNPHATQDYDVTVVEERSSNRFRIPFLMKKRKSMVTLRSTGRTSMYDDRTKPRKTVSQLADETAARLSKASAGRGEHRELPSVNLSSLSLNLGSNNPTPQKRRLVGRRSGFLSTTSLGTSSDLFANKSNAEKTKSSIFFRSSRPLSSRNSSADLKSTIYRSFDRSPDRRSPTHPRPKITLAASPVKEYLEDDLYMAPRLAPTPPNSKFKLQYPHTRNNQEGVPDTLSPYVNKPRSNLSTPANSSHSSLTQRDPPSSQIAFATPLSSATTAATPSLMTDLSSPQKKHIDIGQAGGPSGLRIGRERLTMSVANALEEGLGINIGDETDDDSIYGQSTEDHSVDPKRCETSLSTSETDSVMATSQQQNRHECSAASALEAQSPLSLLISAKDPSQLPRTPLKHRFIQKSLRPECKTLDECANRTICKTSESLKSILGETVSDDGLRETGGSTNVEDLKQLLDFQCSRFDRVAKHLLEIISRHESHKVQYESQLAAMKKDAVKREEQIKHLRELLDVGCSCGREQNASLFYAAPSREAISSTASLEEHLLGNAPKSSEGSNINDEQGSLTTPTKDKRKALTLKRSKTMPQLHMNNEGNSVSCSLSPLVPSPDVSGLSLQFPIPKPISVHSIASTILSSAPASTTSIPPLTSSSTAESELSETLPLRLSRPLKKIQQSSSLTFNNNPHYVVSNPKDIFGNHILACESYARNLNRNYGPSIEKIMKDL